MTVWRGIDRQVGPRGSYRIIYGVDDAQSRLDVVHIDHRSGVYR